jgi:hypothetical protein
MFWIVHHRDPCSIMDHGSWWLLIVIIVVVRGGAHTFIKVLFEGKMFQLIIKLCLVCVHPYV